MKSVAPCFIGDHVLISIFLFLSRLKQITYKYTSFILLNLKPVCSVSPWEVWCTEGQNREKILKKVYLSFCIPAWNPETQKRVWCYLLDCNHGARLSSRCASRTERSVSGQKLTARNSAKRTSTVPFNSTCWHSPLSTCSCFTSM